MGSGSATPTAQRNPSAQVVQILGRYFLVDCGEGAQIQMRRFKVKFQKIDAIFISHLHGDHYLGLMGFLQSLHLLNRNKPLALYGPEPLKEILDIQFKHSYTELKYQLIFHPTNPNEPQKIYEDNCITVNSFPLSHRIPCTGFIFKEKEKLRLINKRKLKEYSIPIAWLQRIKEGQDLIREDGTVVPNHELTTDPSPSRSYAYCSDTIYDIRITEYIKNVTLLYHESTFLNDMQNRAKETFHSTAAEAADIAHKAGVNKLMLGHFSARYGSTQPFLDESTKIFKNTIIAEEGTEFEV